MKAHTYKSHCQCLQLALVAAQTGHVCGQGGKLESRTQETETVSFHYKEKV